MSIYSEIQVKAGRKMDNKKIKVGIIGATGYAGAEIVRLLLPRNDIDIIRFGSRSYAGKEYSSEFGNMYMLADDQCSDKEFEGLADEADVIFTATPQGYLAGILDDEILSKAKVIDLSADYRLKDVATYEKWYKIEHKSPELIKKAVYGLCEINREQIKGTRLVANPGCYTTTSILTLYPLVKERMIDVKSIIVDAKSGVSGAGRGGKVANLFCEVNESIKPYGVATHRHTPEIEEQLGYAYDGEALTINFTPHLVPMNRGILATCYATLLKDYSYEDIRAAYEKYYADEKFIRILKEGVFPETRWVEGSNYTDIGFAVDKRTNRVIACGALDNLVKGAAGQAVQNMNIVMGLPEDAGLNVVPVFP